MSFDHAIAELPQDFDGIGSDVVVVFKDQDGLLSIAVRDGRFDPALVLGGCGHKPRKVDFDRRTLSELEIDFHMTGGLLDDAIDLAEAEARALADRLGGEKGLERSAHGFTG